ncbi:MAG: bifunctional 3,4-dihydroxy-2-butanone-4-phosphate synthase/GTP cyclohydrolase II [Chloroflexota bacterium]|nr:bifunctional 3,4-dihydroxy-2-butanone-4-phosphate synthase/GTP cyclohydrolase II [Chloroflexota bacterium]
MALATVEQVLEDLRAGKFVIVVDDEHRENEGDLVIAAQFATPEAINFMAREARGLICVPLTGERLDRLELPLMVPPEHNTSGFGTAFTVSVEARHGVTTGISAHDRARTVRTLIDPAATPEDLARPGHIFPLRAADGGVLERPGQTEASIDLMKLAGLHPSAVICEIMSADGTMARRAELEEFAARHGFKILSIADLIQYRRLREGDVRRAVEVEMPTEHGGFKLFAYLHAGSKEPDLALVMGELGGTRPPVVRLHSECLTGDVLGSQRCDCGAQLNRALDLIAEEGRGAVLYLRQEGRGIGLLNKLRAYELQEHGLDTVEANEHLGFHADERDYRIAAAMLKDLGVARVRLLSNNPRKLAGLEANGVEVVERVPLLVEPRPENVGYMETKRTKLGHLFDMSRGAQSAASCG